MGSRSWLSRNVVALGCVSLLTDAASEMIVPLLPAFLTGVLGASALALGWIEGVADALASGLKLASGRLADRLGRNLPFVRTGYLISSLARPLVALTGAAWQVLLVRAIDRTGKGIRTSPRDALIVRSVDPVDLGAAFGLNRALDHAGAVLGPLLAAAFLAFGSGDLRALFWLSAVPGALAVLVLFLGVREAPGPEAALRPPGEPSRHEAEPSAPASAPPRALWRFLLPLALFTLGNASDVFLLLKAGGALESLTSLPLLWMALHVVKSLSAVPGGRLADRIGRRRTVALGWTYYAAVYAGLACAQTRGEIALLFVAYGLYHGLTEGAERALVAELAPGRSQGTAFGWYHATLGLLALAASVLFGAIWELAGSRAAFLTSAGLALAAAALLTLLARPAGRAR